MFLRRLGGFSGKELAPSWCTQAQWGWPGRRRFCPTLYKPWNSDQFRSSSCFIPWFEMFQSPGCETSESLMCCGTKNSSFLGNSAASSSVSSLRTCDLLWRGFQHTEACPKTGNYFFLKFFLPENTPYFFHLLPNLPTERLAQERSVSLAAVPSALCCSRLPQTHRKGIFDTLWANGATSGTEIIVQLGPKAALPEFSRFLKDKKLLVRGINTSLPELQVKQAYLRLRS